MVHGDPESAYKVYASSMSEYATAVVLVFIVYSVLLKSMDIVFVTLGLDAWDKAEAKFLVAVLSLIMVLFFSGVLCVFSSASCNTGICFFMITSVLIKGVG